jgi:LCP family protein required for cell wall assembly
MILPIHFHIVELPGFLTDNEIITEDIKAGTLQEYRVINNFISPNKNNMSVTDNITGDGQDEQVHNSVLPMQINQSVEKRNLISFFHKSKLYFIPILWLTGMVLFLLYHSFTYYLFVKKLNRWKLPVTHNAAMQIFSNLCKKHKIKKKIKLEICQSVDSPMVVGLLRPRIVLPSEDFADTQLEIILKHELIHYKHHDIYFKFLLLCVNSVHWFNPFVYFMVKCVNNDIEMVCDEDVISNQDLVYRKAYSLTILQTITNQLKNNNFRFNTYFYGGKKQMKERFKHIMNSSPKKKGTIFFAVLLCLILLSGNFISINNKEAMAKIAKNQITQKQSNIMNINKTVSSNKQEVTSNKVSDNFSILLVGVDGSDIKSGSNRADSILLATINAKTKQLTFTSFLRDTYLEIPGKGKNKLSTAYTLGGINTLKDTLETNYNFDINGTVLIDYTGFEKMIDELDGIKVVLTEQEASYLNHTNYISNPSYRKLKAGGQILNGNQALGYVRIRHVKNAYGTNGDLGRTERQREFLSLVYKRLTSADFKTLLSILDLSLTYISTDLNKNQIISYLHAAFDTEYSLNSNQIPIEGSYKNILVNGMSVLDINLSKNKKEIKNILND